MTQPSDPFRDFGILPPDVAPPAAPIRSYFSAGRVVGQYVATGLVAALGVGATVLFGALMPAPLNLLGGAAAFGAFGIFIYLMTRHDRRWVELDGTTLRARHLYGGGVLERSIDDIESLNTIVHPVVNAAILAVEKIWGRIKGVEIRFRDQRTPLRIQRFDPAMTNAKELIEAVMFRMRERGGLVVDVIQLDGSPLVKQVRRQGRPAVPIPSNVPRVVLGCLILLALMFGGILGLIAGAESRTRALGLVPPREMTLAELIEKGPGEHLHVTVTEFRFGGLSFEGKGGVWRRIWVAMFPKNDPGKEIRAVLESNQISSPAGLAALEKLGKATGICSSSPRTSFGTVLGPQLQKANHGAVLRAAWNIDELRTLPDPETIRNMTLGSAALLGLTIAMILILLWLAHRRTFSGVQA